MNLEHRYKDAPSSPAQIEELRKQLRIARTEHAFLKYQNAVLLRTLRKLKETLRITLAIYKPEPDSIEFNLLNVSLEDANKIVKTMEGQFK